MLVNMTSGVEARYPTGQWLVPRAGTPWWFDSGSLALDFAYTGDAGDPDGTDWSSIDDAVGLGRWLSERFSTTDQPMAESEFHDAVTLRNTIGHLARTAAHGSALSANDIDIINLFAATPDLPPALEGGSKQAGRSVPLVRQALATIARDAVHLFGPQVNGHIRECAAQDCHCVYLDTSRSANRRWCSMQRCGNRAKVRAHRERVVRAPHS